VQERPQGPSPRGAHRVGEAGALVPLLAPLQPQRRPRDHAQGRTGRLASFLAVAGSDWGRLRGWASQVVVLGGGSFGTAMAAHVAAKKSDLEVSMLLRDDLVCRSISNSHINWFVTIVASFS